MALLSSAWASVSGSEAPEGSDPAPAQTRILRQPFLDFVMVGGGSGSPGRRCCARPVSLSVGGECAFLDWESGTGDG